MGEDAHGNDVTSIVLDWSVTPKSKQHRSTRTHAEHVLELAVGQALMQHGKTVKLPDGREVKAVDEKYARAIFKTNYKTELSDKSQQNAFRRALRGGWVGMQMVAGIEYLWI
jgi:hypothetical protein